MRSERSQGLVTWLADQLNQKGVFEISPCETTTCNKTCDLERYWPEDQQRDVSDAPLGTSHITYYIVVYSNPCILFQGVYDLGPAVNAYVRLKVNGVLGARLSRIRFVLAESQDGSAALGGEIISINEAVLLWKALFYLQIEYQLGFAVDFALQKNCFFKNLDD